MMSANPEDTPWYGISVQISWILLLILTSLVTLGPGDKKSHKDSLQVPHSPPQQAVLYLNHFSFGMKSFLKCLLLIRKVMWESRWEKHMKQKWSSFFPSDHGIFLHWFSFWASVLLSLFWFRKFCLNPRRCGICCCCFVCVFRLVWISIFS